MVLENTDNRKILGQTAADLVPYFDELSQAGLCFDVAHAASVDRTLTVAHELLDVHRHRLRHVHLSSLDEDSPHHSLTPADKLRFTPLLDRCRDVPWVPRGGAGITDAAGALEELPPAADHCAALPRGAQEDAARTEAAARST